MFEIVLLSKFCKRLGAEVRAKGRHALKYQLLLILFWFLGEFVSGFLFLFVLRVLFEEELRQYLPLMYLAALLGGGLGAWLVFRNVAKLPDIRSNGPAEQEVGMNESTALRLTCLVDQSEEKPEGE